MCWGSPVPTNTSILLWGLLQDITDVLLAHPGAPCCVWSLGWDVPCGCSRHLGSPAAANEGRALLLVPALLPVTTQKLFKWN